MKKQLFASLSIALLLGCGGGGEGGEQVNPPPASSSVTPQPIPPGFDFPGDRPVVQGWADANDVQQIRTHSWNLWAGMTADSTSSYQGSVLPIWETWCGTAEVFSKTCGPRAKPFRTFEAPRQIVHVNLRPELAAGSQPLPAQVVSFNKFNPSMATFIMTPHPGPGGVDYDYTGQNKAANVAALNMNWPAGTPEADRKIAESPYMPDTPNQRGFAAMETKPVFQLVKSSGGLTPVPIWQGSADSIDPGTPTPGTWKTCVLFDPAKPEYDPALQLRDATPQEIAAKIPVPPFDAKTQSGLSCQAYKYAPLGAIYHFALDATDAAAFNAAQADTQGLTASAGDFAVLVAMHVSTKETVDWTWQTYFWAGGLNPPESFPGGFENQTSKVEKEWRNYAMCANYLQTLGSGSSVMDVCFNPYLETAFGQAGLTSNCMSCHGQAIVGGSPNYPANYDNPVVFNSGPYFENATTTDFSWAIQQKN